MRGLCQLLNFLSLRVTRLWCMKLAYCTVLTHSLILLILTGHHNCGGQSQGGGIMLTKTWDFDVSWLRIPGNELCMCISLQKLRDLQSDELQICLYLKCFKERPCVFSHEVMSDSFADPMDYGLPGSSVHGISQARILKRVTTSFFRIKPTSPTLAGGFFITEPPGKPKKDLIAFKKHKAREAKVLENMRR